MTCRLSSDERITGRPLPSVAERTPASQRSPSSSVCFELSRRETRGANVAAHRCVGAATARRRPSSMRCETTAGLSPGSPNLPLSDSATLPWVNQPAIYARVGSRTTLECWPARSSSLRVVRRGSPAPTRRICLSEIRNLGWRAVRFHIANVTRKCHPSASHALQPQKCVHFTSKSGVGREKSSRDDASKYLGNQRAKTGGEGGSLGNLFRKR